MCHYVTRETNLYIRELFSLSSLGFLFFLHSLNKLNSMVQCIPWNLVITLLARISYIYRTWKSIAGYRIPPLGPFPRQLNLFTASHRVSTLILSPVFSWVPLLVSARNDFWPKSLYMPWWIRFNCFRHHCSPFCVDQCFTAFFSHVTHPDLSETYSGIPQNVTSWKGGMKYFIAMNMYDI